MTTINELRDIVFYIVRKLNDVMVYITTQQQPRRIIEDPFPSDMTIEERIENIERRLNEDLIPSPPTPELIDEEHELIMAQIADIKRGLNDDTPPPPSPQEMIGEFIKQDEERIIDLQKQAHEKELYLIIY